jgi:ribosomal protein L28
MHRRGVLAGFKKENLKEISTKYYRSRRRWEDNIKTSFGKIG